MPGVASRLWSAIRRPAETRENDGGFGMGIGLPNYGGSNGLNPGATQNLIENLATVVACVNAISGSISALPAVIYANGPDGRTEATSHPLSRLIKVGPNRHQTWNDFIEMMLAGVLLTGNAIAIIESDGQGRVTGLLPAPWSCVLVSLLPDGSLAYDITAFVQPFGGTGAPRRYLEHEVLHLRDRSDYGLLGRSRLSRAPSVMYQAEMLQEYSSSVWANSSVPAGALKTLNKLSKETREQLAEDFAKRNQGPRNAKRTVILEQGLSWEPFGISPEDSELLESRKFSTEELCRLFNVPGPIVQDYSHGTYTNSTQAGLFFSSNCLLPWVRKIEAEFKRSVFVEGSPYSLELDMSASMRGDFQARWASYAVAVDKQILTPNEIRMAEGWNPRPEEAEIVPGSAPP